MANSDKNLIRRPYGKDGRDVHLPVDGGAHIYEGTLVAQLAATAMLVPGSTATGGPAVGMATHEVDNSAGDDEDLRCVVETDRIFELANDGSNPFSEDVAMFARAYMVDDHTVGTSTVGGTLKPAGRFVGMTEGGKVRVFVGMSNLGDSLADAGDVAVTDAGSFTAETDVEAALQEIYQHLLTANAPVSFPLRSAREVTSGGDVGNIAANGGVLASDTTPILRADANESEEIAWVADDVDIVSWQVDLPKDFDGTAPATVDVYVASGTTDAASFALLTSWDAETQVTDAFDDSSSKSATFHVVTATIAAADIPDAPVTVTLQLVPPAHSTNAILLKAVRLNYKRKLLTA
jgi:uncharacterized lipoprotein NlpE involved in copper resistance